MKRDKGRKFSVENRKGGVAKTTTGVNLAHGLARRLASNGGGRVLLVDLDPQGDAARQLGLNIEGRCISYVLTGERKLADMIMPASREGLDRPNLFVVPASDNLRYAKERLLAQMATEAVVSQLHGRRRGEESNTMSLLDLLNDRLGVALKYFEYIILDCPPTLDMLQEAVHNFCDGAIVPVKVDFHGTSATGRHTDNILADQSAGIDIAIRAVVPTFVNARHNLTAEMMAELVRVYGKLVTKAVPNTVRVAEAPQYGRTIFEYQPDDISVRAAEAYQDLVDRIYEGR